MSKVPKPLAKVSQKAVPGHQWPPASANKDPAAQANKPPSTASANRGGPGSKPTSSSNKASAASGNKPSLPTSGNKPSLPTSGNKPAAPSASIHPVKRYGVKAMPVPGGVKAGGAVIPLSKRVFLKYDVDGSNSISFSEFRDLCSDFGYLLSDQELEMAIKLLDTNGDNVLQYEEFVKFWNNDERFNKLSLNEDELEAFRKRWRRSKRSTRAATASLTPTNFPACTTTSSRPASPTSPSSPASKIWTPTATARSASTSMYSGLYESEQRRSNSAPTK